MFTEHFSNKQKSVFLHLLNRLVEADGHVSPVERAKLNEYQALYSPIIPEIVADDTLATFFPSRKDKASLLLELLAVGMLNPEYAYNELDGQFLIKLAKDLKVSDQDFGWMKAWVANLLFLLDQTKKIMAD
ncbi:MAG: hypothetical protein LBI10_11915 [Deltaproteobacteria bacterium]|jgi:hypothetical protein|nr:hypothetical protein [Deltaproteobacteria bacterium]